jgi:hypothetical protein
MANPSGPESRGVTLEQYVRQKGGKIDPEWALRILSPVMQAAGELHVAGKIHGSINPRNVFLANTGAVQLLGGDGAPVSASAAGPCTPPELCTAAGAPGPWSDVYSVAVTLYWAVTGYAPTRTPADEVTTPSALGVGIPPCMEVAILKALNVDPGRRFASMSAFDSALRGVLVPSPISDPGETRVVNPVPSQPQIPDEPQQPSTAPTRPIALPPSLPPLSAAASTRPMTAKIEHRPIPIWVVALGVVALGAQVWWMLQGPFQKHAPPTIDRFTATPPQIQAGQTTLLEWSASDPAEVVLDPGNQSLARVGRVSVQPTETVTLKLTARNEYGVASQQLTIEVTGEDRRRAPNRRGRTQERGRAPRF